MLKRLSSTDRQRVADALTKCAAETRDIENPTELANKAYEVFSKELGDKPGLFKAACQVYNSCKSIHKLDTATDSDRGNSFAILNVPEMSSRLANANRIAMQKAASQPALFTKVVHTPVVEPKLEKAASEKKDIRPAAPEFTRDSYYKFLCSDLEETERMLLKAANACRSTSEAVEEAEELFTASMSTVPGSVRKEACARLYATYGEDFSKLVDLFNTKRPMQKLASSDYKNKYKGTPRLTEPEIVAAAEDLMKLGKKASEDNQVYDYMLEESLNTVKDHIKFYKNLSKTAADGKGDTFSTAVVKAKALSDIGELIGDSRVDADAVDRKIYTTKLINAIVGHAAQRAVIKAVQNNAIAKYPLPEIVDAANRAFAQMPLQLRQMPATANQALFESMLMKELATRSTPSKADIQSISELTKSFGGLRPVYAEA